MKVKKEWANAINFKTKIKNILLNDSLQNIKCLDYCIDLYY